MRSSHSHHQFYKRGLPLQYYTPPQVEQDTILCHVLFSDDDDEICYDETKVQNSRSTLALVSATVPRPMSRSLQLIAHVSPVPYTFIAKHRQTEENPVTYTYTHNSSTFSTTVYHLCLHTCLSYLCDIQVYSLTHGRLLFSSRTTSPHSSLPLSCDEPPPAPRTTRGTGDILLPSIFCFHISSQKWQVLPSHLQPCTS